LSGEVGRTLVAAPGGFRVALHGFVALRRPPVRNFTALTLALDGELIALNDQGNPVPSALCLTPDTDGPWGMQAGKFGTVLYPVLVGVLDPADGPLPVDVRVSGKITATTSAGETLQVFSRIERLSRRYAPPASTTPPVPAVPTSLSFTGADHVL